jgi:hypothetical protein
MSSLTYAERVCPSDAGDAKYDQRGIGTPSLRWIGRFERSRLQVLSELKKNLETKSGEK